MERHQELKRLGFFGILKESFKLIFSLKKLFTQISLALLIPISIILEVKILTAILFSFNMFKNRDEPEDFTVFIIPQYSTLNISYIASFKWVAFWLLSEITYLILLLVLSILSTVTIAFTTASIYKSKETTTFKKAAAAVPKLWKPVLITFLLVFAVTFAYDYILGPVLGLILRLLFFKKFAVLKIVIGVILTVLYIAVFVYITLIWHMGTVVSALENDIYGAKAIIKGRNLLKGKMKASVAVFVVLLTLSAGIDTAFVLVVVYETIRIWAVRIGVGILLVLLKLLMVLLGLVAQTVIYFVCKSYHDETFENLDDADDQKVPIDVQYEKLPV
ncbi:hypothetical protein CUMW_219330 [Citrus unshiu]|uniref:Glycerophosphoryl diester phosphodiesterase membrane domain-containing protein n=2 Tax=Citrus TaxID=2706 RepID=A0A067E9G7_CITSI|nr:hypothetical protein CISIN_1g020089mg [Citrus sinensis]GAY62623.1 hypothetical protein CUMW_219330 [Citrus unshiu]